ncbi:hypothetical protein OE88DRAFT_1657101 [Heliocybe sulcata]|uniref:Uncharacterized protein n=1 Tax=Heliocybe sulcata TaxID=5364 RepID=A0A5C3N7Y7_9AGAM|nr:hypothetical protein OE88DRAFT_1657101 [Heliocybe sulcata]
MNFWWPSFLFFPFCLSVTIFVVDVYTSPNIDYRRGWVIVAGVRLAAEATRRICTSRAWGDLVGRYHSSSLSYKAIGYASCPIARPKRNPNLWLGEHGCRRNTNASRGG